MYSWNLENERVEAETYLACRRTDFTATYMQVANLQYIIAQQPEIIGPDTVSALCSVLEGTEHDRQRQVFFLFKKAADAIVDIICQSSDWKTAETARRALTRLLAAHSGHRFRAVAEAMGPLPLKGSGPALADFQTPAPTVMPVPDISAISGRLRPGCIQWMGRSAIIGDRSDPENLLVIKFARQGQALSELAAETCWMQYLSRLSLPAPFAFDIPRPAQAVAEPVVWRIDDPDLQPPAGSEIDERRHAIAFTAHQGYFRYPNHPANGKMAGKDECLTTLARNAGILGCLASLGIIHTAPIPLFHNRVQRHRRNDSGLYEWRRGGRLDQWLDSCRFPNISSSGIRDFEHFIAFDGPARRLYDHIGTHVLSLVLVAGSYCRNHDESRVGMDAHGRPADTRDLFDAVWLKHVLIEIFIGYYKGFTQNAYAAALPFDPDGLSRRLIEEMGVDRHMEEILRVAEQQAMKEADFTDFLAGRGVAADSIAGIEKGRRDIHILTGPHLGGFNEGISVPELIEYTAALSALCIMDGYCRQKSAGCPNPAPEKAACL